MNQKVIKRIVEQQGENIVNIKKILQEFIKDKKESTSNSLFLSRDKSGNRRHCVKSL